MITIQANTKKSQTKLCNVSSCVEGGDAILFYTSLCLLALGCGGVKGSIAALGADQFDRNDPEGGKAVASYFNYYQFSTTLGSLTGVTTVIWIALNKGWHWAFFTGLVTAFFSFLVLGHGNPYYLFQPLSNRPLVRISQVIIAAIQKRNLNCDELYETDDEKDSKEKIAHTKQLRFLDKADVRRVGTEPQRACTVMQVEEVKILIRMLPIIANTCLAQLQTFSVVQGYLMEPHLGSLKIPTPSIPVIPLIFMAVLLPLYEFFFIPFSRKITGHLNGITQLQRVEIGLVLSIISMGIAGLIEVKRRDRALKPISIFWLSFQYGVFGVADMFTQLDTNKL